MKKNMGSTDRVIRVMIAVVIALLVYSEVLTGVLGIVLLVLTGVLVLTSLLSFCPLYTLFGISTCSAKKSVS